MHGKETQEDTHLEVKSSFVREENRLVYATESWKMKEHQSRFIIGKKIS